MVECADSRHATLCDADSRGFIVVAFCSAILHHWMCKIPTEVATLTVVKSALESFNPAQSYQTPFSLITVNNSCYAARAN
ncbi:hypothetical protein PsalN5692_02003 [Piscirickettsia salmonis]|nr:hypothetical protein PsalN5692_02003 [Piscirickettsia salmonis]